MRLVWKKKPYVYLLLISVTFWLCYVFTLLLQPQFETLLQWFGRLSASIFGAYLTAIFVDGSFREQEENRKNRILEIAYDDLSVALSREKRLIEEMYKASIVERPEEEVQTLNDLINSESFDNIQYLDLGGTCPRANLPDMHTWHDEIVNTSEKTQKEIDNVIRRYGYFMDPNLIEKLNWIKGSIYYNTMRQTREINHRRYRVLFTDDTLYEAYIEYIEWLEDICEETNTEFGEYELKKLCNENMAPSTGSSTLIGTEESESEDNSDQWKSFDT